MPKNYDQNFNLLKGEADIIHPQKEFFTQQTPIVSEISNFKKSNMEIKR